MFTVRDISYNLNGKNLFRNFSYNFEKGKIYSLLGLNGSGKSTLLKIFSGVLTGFTGNLFWNEKNLLALNRLERSQLITLIQQNAHITFDYTVEQIIEMGAFLNQNYSNAMQCILHSLELVDAVKFLQRPITQLSGGERQRIYIARALAVGSEILLLDEPTSFLDIKHKKKIWNLIKSLSKEKIIIVSTHDLEMALKFSQEGILLNENGSIHSGLIENVLNELIF